MAVIKFEVGRKYYDNFGKLRTCTKRTDKSAWFNGYRFVIHNRYGIEYVNGAVRISADNYDDIEVQRDRALKELLTAVSKVCENDMYDYIYENEEEIYSLCKDLKEYLEEYTTNKVKLDGIED